MPKFRGYTRDYLKETMIDEPRRQQMRKEAKEAEEIEKLDEKERAAKTKLTMTEKLAKMR